MIDTSRLTAQLRSHLTAYLKDRGDAEHLSCLSVAVSLPERTLVTAQAGTTRRGGEVTTNDSHLFQIGSNTKAFTATAVLKLAADGLVDIDQPIGAYLVDCWPFCDVTLRQCLQMTGHIESYDNLKPWADAYARSPYAEVPAKSLLDLASGSPRRSEGWYYSNTGYLLAQLVVQGRSRGGYAAAVGDILTTCGLKDTFYAPHIYAPEIAERIVAGYYLNDDPGLESLTGTDITPYSVSWAQGAGAMVATPSDLARWARYLYQGNPIIPFQQSEMWRLVSMKSGYPITEPNAESPGFGLGVGKSYDASLFGPNDQFHWFYEGETLGFRALHIYSPALDFVLCLFANSRPTKTNDQMRALSLRLYGEVTATLVA